MLHAALSFINYVSFQSSSAFLLFNVRRRRRNIVFWVHPLLMKGIFRGTFNIKHDELRQDSKTFYNYYRMSMFIYMYILRQDTNFRLCVCSIPFRAAVSSGSDSNRTQCTSVSTTNTVVTSVRDYCHPKSRIPVVF